MSKCEIFDRSDFHKTDCKHCLEQLHEQSADGEQAQFDKDGADGGVNLRQLHSRQPRRLEPTGAVASSKTEAVSILQKLDIWSFTKDVLSDIGLDKSVQIPGLFRSGSKFLQLKSFLHNRI